MTAWPHGTAPADLPRAGRRNGGRPRPLKPAEVDKVFKVAPDDEDIIRIDPVPPDAA